MSARRHPTCSLACVVGCGHPCTDWRRPSNWPKAAKQVLGHHIFKPGVSRQLSVLEHSGGIPGFCELLRVWTVPVHPVPDLPGPPTCLLRCQQGRKGRDAASFSSLAPLLPSSFYCLAAENWVLKSLGAPGQLSIFGLCCGQHSQPGRIKAPFHQVLCPFTSWCQQS